MIDFTHILDWAKQTPLIWWQAGGTVIWVILLFLIQIIGNRWIGNQPIRSVTYRRKWVVAFRRVRMLIFIFGLLLIWSTELRTAAISAVAFMVAIVIATKELMCCVLGGIFKVNSNAYTIGDRIRIDGYHGDVIDQSLLYTRLQEVSGGQYTGKVITLPNAMFLGSPICNDTLGSGGVVFGMLEVSLARSDNWKHHENILLTSAKKACAKCNQQVHKPIQELQQAGIDFPSVEPRVLLRVERQDTVILTLRFPATMNSCLSIEQDILRDYLQQSES